MREGNLNLSLRLHSPFATRIMIILGRSPKKLKVSSLLCLNTYTNKVCRTSQEYFLCFLRHHTRSNSHDAPRRRNDHDSWLVLGNIWSHNVAILIVIMIYQKNVTENMSVKSMKLDNYILQHYITQQQLWLRKKN